MTALPISYHVYGLQAVGQPEGSVKIGFSYDPMKRLAAHQPGSLGARLHIIFQVEAGQTAAAGRRLERMYHIRFAPLRMSGEWFRFDPEMLTWRPDGSRVVHRATGSPASNTRPDAKADPGDLSMFGQSATIGCPIPIPVTLARDPGDISAALTLQKIYPRDASLRHASLPRAPLHGATPRHAPHRNVSSTQEKVK